MTENPATQQIQVFEWFAWDRFLITHAAPDAVRVKVTPGVNLRGVAQSEAPAMVHINLSRPAAAFPDYAEWLHGYEQAGHPVVNGYFESIDKWATQDACKLAGLPHARADRIGDPDELLVIKARANHYGRFERRLPPEMVGDMAPPPWPYPERVHKAKRSEVPEDCWVDPRMTVERYIGNSEGKFQRAYVAGNYVAVATSWSPDLVKEMEHRPGVELVSTNDASTRQPDNCDSLWVAYRLAEMMRADFAALDLALDDTGTVYAIDLNTTPFWGAESSLNPRLIGELVEAFSSLIASGSQYAPADRETGWSQCDGSAKMMNIASN